MWCVDVEHETDDGWTLVEGDRDLFGAVQVYSIKGTRYEVIRTPKGWRARLRAHGHARRRLQGPPWESAPQAVRYLERYGYI